jgi:hypothetical protein
VIVKFAPGAGLVVEGQLDAGGTRGAPIYLTALSDDAHGGDTDNVDRDPARGEWLGLQLNPNNTSVTVRLEDVSILYAVTGVDILNPVDLQVSNLTIAESQLFGMACQAPLPASPEEMEIEFENNGQDVSGCAETILVSP